MPACVDLIGLPYELGADGTGSIDCIHLVYICLAELEIPTPDFQSSWYDSPRKTHLRALLNWGDRVQPPIQDGDVLFRRGANPTFAVAWDSGILLITDSLNRVHWVPTLDLKAWSVFRYCPTKGS